MSKKKKKSYLELLQHPIPTLEYRESNPFRRELLRRELISYRSAYYKVFSEVFTGSSGGVDHLWVFFAVLHEGNYGMHHSYFAILSLFRWYLKQGFHSISKKDLRISGYGHRQVQIIIYKALEDGYLRRGSKYGNYELTESGTFFVDKVYRRMYNAVANIYLPIPEKGPKEKPDTL